MKLGSWLVLPPRYLEWKHIEDRQAVAREFEGSLKVIKALLKLKRNKAQLFADISTYMRFVESFIFRTIQGYLPTIK